MGSLLVVTGPPGAGKSTVAAMLAERLDPSALVSGDRFFGFLATGAMEPWRPESHAQNTVVTEAAAAATARFAADYDTVFDGVVGPWFLPTFAAAAGLAQLDYVVLLPSEATCVRRVRSRTGHGFTDVAATRTMHAQFADASIGDRHVIANDGDDPLETADRVDEARRTGSLCHLVEPS
ncbi:MAG: AAA family ATPase [Actinomycetota bacterium]